MKTAKWTWIPKRMVATPVQKRLIQLYLKWLPLFRTYQADRKKLKEDREKAIAESQKNQPKADFDLLAELERS